MHDLIRTVVAGTVGAVVALTVVGGPPALADAVRAAVPDGSVTTAKLADEAVTRAKLAKNAVSAAKLTAGSVTEPKLADDSVTGRSLADGAVGGSQVYDQSLSADDLAYVNISLTLDFGPVPAGSCAVSGKISLATGVRGHFFLVSQPAGVAGALVATVREDPDDSSAVGIVLCNNGTGTFDPPARAYSLAMIRAHPLGS